MQCNAMQQFCNDLPGVMRLASFARRIEELIVVRMLQ
jgi:hypothetical protein